MRRAVVRGLRRPEVRTRQVYSFNRPTFTINNARWYSDDAHLTEEQAKTRVLRVVSEFHKVDKSKVNENAHFYKDLGLDSLDQVELVLALEDEFAIMLTEEEQEKLATVKDTIHFIAHHPGSV
eukprot:TRINITY_DN406_c0_g1_i1.p1 TRINITY_DN406_c0_g1~~TRINITY_DN406_c0_g1_i1.p1  ORF type:complete len:131 (-),score=39.40 TRINITY_DN406_c0_g1_i1:64-432(-)